MIIAIVLLVIVAFCAGYYAGTGHHKADLEELERWRIGSIGGRQWLAESPDAVLALDMLRGIAKGRIPNDWEEARDTIRARDAAK